MKKVLIVIQGLLMFLLVLIVTSFIYAIFTSGFTIFTGIEDVNPQVDYCLMVMAVMITIIPLYLWYRKLGNNGVVEQVNLKEVITLKNIGIYLMMGIGCQFLVSGVLSLLRPLLQTLFASYDVTISSILPANTIIVGVYVIIIGPVFEELMLRGILFNRLRYGISFIAANIIQAAAFGIYHFDIIQGLYAFVLGLLLGYVYEKTRTLLAPILAHVFINASGFLLQQFDLGKYIPIWLGIISGAILLFIAINLFIKETSNRNDAGKATGE